MERGLDWLVKTQSNDGLWHAAGTHPIPVSCIAGLALLHRINCGGDVERYRQSVYKLSAELYACADRHTGLIRDRHAPKPEPDKQTHISEIPFERCAYDHGFALLFLTQIWQSEIFDAKERELLKFIIMQGVQFAETHQSEDGRWYQDYNRGYWDIPTAMHLYALISARRAGFRVSDDTLNKLRAFNVKYIKEAGTSRFLPAKLAIHFIGNWYEDACLGDGFRWFQKQYPENALFELDKMKYPQLTHLYASVFHFYLGGDIWADYYKNIAEWYLANQCDDGKWLMLYEMGTSWTSDTYTTAVACLILQMPHRGLPIYKNIDSAAIREKLKLED